MLFFVVMPTNETPTDLGQFLRDSPTCMFSHACTHVVKGEAEGEGKKGRAHVSTSTIIMYFTEIISSGQIVRSSLRVGTAIKHSFLI